MARSDCLRVHCRSSFRPNADRAADYCERGGYWYHRWPTTAVRLQVPGASPWPDRIASESIAGVVSAQTQIGQQIIVSEADTGIIVGQRLPCDFKFLALPHGQIGLPPSPLPE